MSHDRGCFRCFEDPCSYRACRDPTCPKKDLVVYWDSQKMKNAWSNKGNMAKDLILAHHLARQADFSFKTFGPGNRTEGLIDHILKELDEIKATNGEDLMEWIDVIILALDGALRAGFKPQEISNALDAKQTVNESRKWPDWRTADPGKAIEHIKD